MLEFFTYFIIGGLVVSTTTMVGAKGHGMLAAFVSMFPCVSVLTFFLIYKAGGNSAVITFAKSFVYVVPPWVLYICVVYFLCERLGIWPSLALGIALYVVSSLLLWQLR